MKNKQFTASFQEEVFSDYTNLQKFKRIILYFLLSPRILFAKLTGNTESFNTLASIFRYFPFCKLDNEKISFMYKDKNVIFNFGHQNALSAGTFFNDEYINFIAKNKTIIDIGSALGDTPMLFALQGAKKVYGYELSKKNHEIASLNIKQNNLSNKIELYCAGIHSKIIKKDNKVLGAVINNQDYGQLSDKFYTIKQITNLHKIKDGVLKIDIDGFEYDIFENTSNDVFRRFSHIFLEYHYGPEKISHKLRTAGFKVLEEPIVKTHISSHPPGYKDMDIGMISATRQ